MRKVLSASLIVAALTSAAGAQPAPKALENYAREADALIQPYIKADAFSGTVLAAKDGKILFQKAYGLADREWNVANTLDTKFRLGSITKQFTAAAILQLAEQGKLSIDDSISKYYTDAPASWAKVTIKHLLTHMSGIPSYTDIPGFFENQAFNDLTPEGIIKLTRDKPLQFEPGTQFRYDNSGYVLLGYIIEKASGLAYAEYVQKHIFDVLGMRNSGYDSSTTIIARRASGYQPKGKGWQNAAYLSMTLPYAAGSLYSTVGDLLIWDQALYTDKALNAASLKQQFTDYGNKYGFGWGIDKAYGHDLVSHGGGINGFATFIARYPQDRLLVVALSNYANGPSFRLAAELAGQYYYDTGAKSAVATLSSAQLDAYVGKFQTANSVITVARQGNELSFENTPLSQERPSPAHRMLALSQTEFVLAPLESKVAFTRDAAGAVTALTVNQNGAATEAKRTTQAEIDSRVSALADRIKSNKPSAEAEAALRRIIAGIQNGQPPFEELLPALANAMRPQMAALQSMAKGWGALKTLTFKGVGPAGADIYEVEFEKAKTEWRIGPPVDGKVALLNFRPL